MKPITLIYCGADGAAAKAFAASLRDGKRLIILRDAYSFTGAPDRCDSVFVMDDVPGWHRDRINAAYGVRTPCAAPAPEAPVKRKRGRPKKVIAHGA